MVKERIPTFKQIHLKILPKQPINTLEGNII